MHGLHDVVIDRIRHALPRQTQRESPLHAYAPLAALQADKPRDDKCFAVHSRGIPAQPPTRLIGCTITCAGGFSSWRSISGKRSDMPQIMASARFGDRSPM